MLANLPLLHKQSAVACGFRTSVDRLPVIACDCYRSAAPRHAQLQPHSPPATTTTTAAAAGTTPTAVGDKSLPSFRSHDPGRPPRGRVSTPPTSLHVVLASIGDSLQAVHQVACVWMMGLLLTNKRGFWVSVQYMIALTIVEKLPVVYSVITQVRQHRNHAFHKQ